MHFENRAIISIRHPEVEEYRPYFRHLPSEIDSANICPLSIQINNWIPKNQKKYDFVISKMDDVIKKYVFTKYRIQKGKWLFFQTGDFDQTLPSLSDFLVLKESSVVGDMGLYHHAECLETQNISKCKYLMGFQGDAIHPVRKKMIKILANRKDSIIICLVIKTRLV